MSGRTSSLIYFFSNRVFQLAKNKFFRKIKAARSEFIQHAVESGELRIQKALYHLGSGTAEWK